MLDSARGKVSALGKDGIAMVLCSLTARLHIAEVLASRSIILRKSLRMKGWWLKGIGRDRNSSVLRISPCHIIATHNIISLHPFLSEQTCTQMNGAVDEQTSKSSQEQGLSVRHFNLRTTGTDPAHAAVQL